MRLGGEIGRLERPRRDRARVRRRAAVELIWTVSSMELWGFKKLACDSLTLQIGRVQLCSNNWAFAAVLSDGSVVTWAIGSMVAAARLCRIG